MSHTAVTMGHHIYLAGGLYGLGWLDNTLVQRVETSMESLGGDRTWARGADMLQGREGACAVATSNNTFIVIGGQDDLSILSSVEEFNTETGTWRSRAAMSGEGRYSHKCVNIGRDILVVGGFDGHDWLDSALLYRVDTDTWSTAARLNQKKSDGEMVVVNGRIFYLGGKQAFRYLANVH